MENNIYSALLHSDEYDSFDSSDSDHEENITEIEEVEEEELDYGDNETFVCQTDVRDETVANRTWHYRSRPCAATENAFSAPVGLTDKSKNVTSIDESFLLLFDNKILDLIVHYTNKKANDSGRRWENVDKIEIKAFIGILIISGRFREHRESIHSLWNTNKAFSRSIYRAAMSRNRFQDIMRYIRFDDVSTRNVGKENDKLAAIREVIEIIAKNCRECYEASGYGTVDEQLVTYRGRCPFKVYIPSKPGKYGIKIWMLCDSKTYYCCNFEIYTGKIGNTREVNQGPRVVQTLTTFWENSWRHITTDNFFTDITLAETLLARNLTLSGTIRKNRKDIPKGLLSMQGRELYSSYFLFCDQLTLVSYAPKARKHVILLSSKHHDHEISAKEEKFKPTIIMDYNKTKGGVDCLDKLVREYTCKRATRRWPLCLIMNFIDVCSYNSFVIWTTKNPDWNSNVSAKRRRKVYLQNLGQTLVHENIERRAQQIENNGQGFSRITSEAIEETGHFIASTAPPPSTDRKRSRCWLCRGNDNKYSTRCVNCRKFVCKQHSNTMKTITCTTCQRQSPYLDEV